MKTPLHLTITLFGLVSFPACRDFGDAPPAVHPLGLRGFCYTSFDSAGFRLGNQMNAIADLQQQTSNNWIALSTFEYQSTSTSHDIGPNTTGINPLTGNVWSTTSTTDDIREAVREARMHGMNIMLKPHVDLYSGEWRALIQPDDQGDWFRSYTAMITRQARLSADLDVEMLCIGTELVVATQAQFTSAWRSVIDSVKKYYRGNLTYAANWNGAFSAGITTPEFAQVLFWDRLDYIGIDAYYPVTGLATEPAPSLSVALGRMGQFAHSIIGVSMEFRRPVLLTEVGIQSVQGALSAPWDFSRGTMPGAVQDDAVQELYYRVVFEAFGRSSWCSGIFWWNWESVASSFAATNYTPRNKPAADIVRSWYSSPQ